MKTFYTLLQSRLGLQHAPIGSNEHNLGVEEGPKALWTQFSLNNVPHYSKTFPLPEAITTDSYLITLFTHYNQAISEICSQWQKNTSLVTFGGDHSVSYISINAVLDRYGAENTGILFFDSHADLHLEETSPTGNFHGMWMRTFFDQFKQNSYDNKKIHPSQLAYIGNLLLEPEEEQYINKNTILTIDSQAISSNASKVTLLKKWLHSHKHLHITFDVDVFSSNIFSATGTPNPEGLSKKEVFQLLSLVTQHPSISLDIVEYNPSRITTKYEPLLIKEVYRKIIG